MKTKWQLLFGFRCLWAWWNHGLLIVNDLGWLCLILFLPIHSKEFCLWRIEISKITWRRFSICSFVRDRRKTEKQAIFLVLDYWKLRNKWRGWWNYRFIQSYQSKMELRIAREKLDYLSIWESWYGGSHEVFVKKLKAKSKIAELFRQFVP